MLKYTIIQTPLGKMQAVASEDTLYLLEFIDCEPLTITFAFLEKQLDTKVSKGSNCTLELVRDELSLYFSGKSKILAVPFKLVGTPFQKLAWNALLKVPYGAVQSYAQQAKAIKKPTACRAVANANGANLLSILVPCHRIINTNGKLCGYGGGIERKRELLRLEGFYKNG